MNCDKVQAVFFGVFAGCWATWAAATGSNHLSSNSLGNIGLLQTPTARFNNAGTFRVGFASARPIDSTFLSVQPYDWLEATYRYSTLRYSDEVGDFTNDGYLDKSFDAKLRLAEEGAWQPELAVGLLDIGGTGLLAGEYVVGSKRLGGFDVSIGVGWGRLGARGDFQNPYAVIDESFETRDREFEEGGQFEVDRMFRGQRVAVFGGVRWVPEGSPWSVMLEYEGNDYSQEPFDNDLQSASPVNFGVAYQRSAFGVHLGYERGDQLVFGLHVETDLSDPGPAKTLDPPPTPVGPPNFRSVFSPQVDDAGQGELAWVSALRLALARQEIQLVRIRLSGGSDRQVLTWVSSSRYRSPVQYQGRVARALTVFAPQSVSRLTVIPVRHGLEQMRVTYFRPIVQRSASGWDAPDTPMITAAIEPPAVKTVSEDPEASDGLYEFSWFTGPRFKQSLGDPDDSYRAHLFWQFGLIKRWSPYWTSSLVAEIALIGNLDEIERESDSQLPRVRSNVAKYFDEGANGLRRLETNFIYPVTSELFARVSAGIFEEMYAGVGSEVLYRPHAKNWAVGANLNRVRQRDFDQRLSFREYETTTGHLTWYAYWEELSVRSALSVGRYLARDSGATLVLSRVFKTGAEVGVFASKTNVSSEEFGEGSFDKGFFIRIPFDLLVPRSSRRAINLSFRPLTRDGGQMVRDGIPLYHATEDRNLSELRRRADEMMN